MSTTPPLVSGLKPQKPPKISSRYSSSKELSFSSASFQSEDSMVSSTVAADDEEEQEENFVDKEDKEEEDARDEEDAKQEEDREEDEFEAALGPLTPVPSVSSCCASSSSAASSASSSFKSDMSRNSFVPLTKATMSSSSSAFFANKSFRAEADGARANRMKMAKDALAELDNSVALETKYEAAQTELTSEEIAERSFRKFALFGTRAEKVAQERKAVAEAAEKHRQEVERQKREQERALVVLYENTQKRRSMNAMEGERAQRQAEKSDELDVHLRPLPPDWAGRDYNLPVAEQKYWAISDQVYFCTDCKLQFLSGSDPLTSRRRCLACGQIYCASCCPPVGYSSTHKDLGKFPACKLCVQTTIAVAEKLKHRGDKNDQLRRVIAEKVEAGGDHCLVIGCQEHHRQHYCKYCKSKDATHFSFKCPKAPKSRK